MVQTFDADLPHGITLACRATGSPDRPLVVFLHGFPEAAFVWDEVMQALAPRWRCVAPNLRGYAGSSSPSGAEHYRARALLTDITALIDLLGGHAHAVVAHDWGGALGWHLGIAHPQRLGRLAILNSPHPWTFARELAHSPEQQAASTYMNFLRRPDAEDRLAADDHAILWRFFGDAPWLTPALKARYRDAWASGLSGPLNYYRASPLHPPTGSEPGASGLRLTPQSTTVTMPTLVVWGEQDLALRPGLLDGLQDCLPHGRIVRWPDASHWLVHEHPQRVVRTLEAFFDEDNA